jgi:HEAT repeat protein
MISPNGHHARMYAARMEKTKDTNSCTKNRTLRDTYNKKMPSLLDHEEAVRRLGAVNRLGKMRNEGGAHAHLVVERLEDDDPSVRRRACWALKEMTAKKLEPHKALIGGKLKHKSPEVRSLAAELLAFMGKLAMDVYGTNARLLEERLVGDDSVLVRQSCAEAFSKWGHVTPVSCAGGLAKALGDSDPLVRKLACLALGSLGPAARKFESQVSGLLLDPDAMVRRVAQPSLQQIRGK